MKKIIFILTFLLHVGFFVYPSFIIGNGIDCMIECPGVKGMPLDYISGRDGAGGWIYENGSMAIDRLILDIFIWLAVSFAVVFGFGIAKSNTGWRRFLGMSGFVLSILVETCVILYILFYFGLFG